MSPAQLASLAHWLLTRPLDVVATTGISSLPVIRVYRDGTCADVSCGPAGTGRARSSARLRSAIDAACAGTLAPGDGMLSDEAASSSEAAAEPLLSFALPLSMLAVMAERFDRIFEDLASM